MGWLVFQTRDAEARSRVEREYSLTVSPEWCADAGQLLVRGLAEGTLGVVCDIADASGHSTLPAVRRLRATRPTLPIVLWCRPNDLEALAPSDAGQLGFDAVVFRQHGKFEERALTQFFPREAIPYAMWIEQALERRVPSEFRGVVRTCLHPDNLGLVVEELALRIGQPRRTLAHHLKRGHLPSIAELQMWGRLLAAGWALAHSHTPVERVAQEQGFASAGSLRAALKRRTTDLPHDLRRPEGFTWTLRCFEHELDRLKHQEPQ